MMTGVFGVVVVDALSPLSYLLCSSSWLVVCGPARADELRGPGAEQKAYSLLGRGARRVALLAAQLARRGFHDGRGGGGGPQARCAADRPPCSACAVSLPRATLLPVRMSTSNFVETQSS